ncbi:hypothetical protein [Polaromonas sp.]|jgi:hypothetical protein|nr:hypothetical protein [Polaromonas sp.]MBT9474641.1 hypothetical protein [Polaromonas sp.]
MVVLDRYGFGNYKHSAAGDLPGDLKTAVIQGIFSQFQAARRESFCY